MEAGKARNRGGRPQLNYNGDEQPIVDFFHKHLNDIKNRRTKKQAGLYQLFPTENQIQTLAFEKTGILDLSKDMATLNSNWRFGGPLLSRCL